MNKETLDRIAKGEHGIHISCTHEAGEYSAEVVIPTSKTDFQTFYISATGRDLFLELVKPFLRRQNL